MKVKLSDLYDIGSSKRVFQSEWREEGIPFYRAREIAKLSVDGYVDNELFIDEELYLEYVQRYGKPEAGDVMVTGVGTLGVCYIVKPKDKFYFKDGNILWFKQKAQDRILPDYLKKAFDSKEVKEFIDKNSSGTTVGTFTIQTAKKMEISLPTIEEQIKIVNKISRIERIIKQRKNELELLDNLVKSRFVEMFDGKGYSVLKWNDVFSTTTGKLDSNASVDDGQYPFFTCSKEALRIDEYAFDQEALLLAGNNAAGKYDVKYYKGKFNAYQRTYVLGLKGDWSYQLFRYQLEDKLIYLQQQSLGGLTKYLTMKILSELEFIVPPMEKQTEFEEFVQQVDKLKFFTINYTKLLHKGVNSFGN